MESRTRCENARQSRQVDDTACAPVDTAWCLGTVDMRIQFDGHYFRLGHELIMSVERIIALVCLVL